MNKLFMKSKGVRATTIIKGVIHISSNRCKGQCLIIVMDVIAKANSFGIPKSEKLIKLLRNGIKIGRLDFALITAHAKLGVYFREVGEMLIQPKKGTTESTLNIHCFKIMGEQKWIQMWGQIQKE